MARLERIVRYPVKGLRGQPLDDVRLETGRGLAYDRALAIETGSAESADGWAPRESFYHLARDTDLIRYAARVDEGAGGPTVVLEPPDHHPLEVRLSSAYREVDLARANATIADLLPAGRMRTPRLAMPGVALWDWPDAALSLINLDTVEELSERAGRALDPRRFRANLYVSGLGAWAEFGLLGRRIRIGDATLEIVQPTDRCRATTVDPRTGDTEVNLPALLASRLGHMYCGVYARVADAGRIEVGSQVSVGAPDVRRPAAAEQRWPRRAEVVSTVPESDAVTSFWLRDPFGFASGARPGQHLRLHPPGDPSAPLWRCYTISAVDGDAYRISVKRDGVVSSLLHDTLAAGDGLVVTGPFGDVTLDPEDARPLLLISAGIGLTPTVAMLRGLGKSDREVRVVHVDRGAPPGGLWRDVESALDRLPNGAAVRYDTTLGRPGPEVLGDLAREFTAEPVAYVCGPAGFYDDVRDALVGAGLDESSIRHEVFFSPSTAERTEPKPPPEPGPFAVRFALPGEVMDGTWDAERGSLLDVGESLGLPMPSGCRAGVCGSCALRVRAGETAYVTDPSVPAPKGTTLLCSAVPTSDVTIDL